MLGIRVLGPVEATVGGITVALPSVRTQTVVAALALASGRVVTRDRLVDVVWGEHPPASADTQVAIQISRLRKLCGGTAIETVGPGYRLDPGVVEVDTEVAERLLDAAREQHRTELFREALRQWRGPVCEGIDSPALAPAVQRWEELYLAAVEEWAALELDTGGERGLIPVLPELVSRYPLREGLRARLIEALWRCGRRADALASFDDGRRLLADELGLDPGAELTGLHQQILEADVPAVPLDPAVAAALVTPRQLPMDLADVTGRGHEIAAADDVLARTGSGGAVLVLHGPGGVGKTTLAVHLGHRWADRFPDGQVFVNLHGYGIDAPVDDATALGSLLRAFGVRESRIPDGMEDRSRLFRSTVADRRALLVLDNVRDSVQVRSLLPSGSSVVLVTSRSQLRSLAAREGAHRIVVEPLRESAAVELLRARRSPSAARWRDEELTELARLCGHLPVALGVAAERANRYPDQPLAEMTAELREGPLDVLTTWEDDPSSDVRAVVAWSYDALDAAPARLFRLLGLHPHPAFDTSVAAALGALGVGEATQVLDHLADQHLVAETEPGAFEIHDLIHAYARRLAGSELPETERVPATVRMRAWYVHSLYRARAAVGAAWTSAPTIAACPPEVEPVTFADADASRRWFAHTRHRCHAVMEQAVREHDHVTVQQLAGLMSSYAFRLGAYGAMLRLAERSVTAARIAGDTHGNAVAIRTLGLAQRQVGDLEGALQRLTEAETLFERVEDERSAAFTRWNQSVTLLDLERPADALATLDRISDQIRAEAWFDSLVLNARCAALTALRRLDDAIDAGAAAVTRARAAGDPFSEATATHSWAEALSWAGAHDRALEGYERAVDGLCRLGIHTTAVGICADLGRAQLRAGRDRAARETWRRALTMMDEHQVEDGVEIRRSTLRELLAEAGR